MESFQVPGLFCHKKQPCLPVCAHWIAGMPCACAIKEPNFEMLPQMPPISCMAFIVAGANLCANLFGIDAAAGGDRSPEGVLAALRDVVVPAFRADRSKKIAVTEAEAKKQAEEGDAALGVDVEAEFARLGDTLPPPSALGDWKMAPEACHLLRWAEEAPPESGAWSSLPTLLARSR